MTADPIAVWSSFLASPEASKTAMSPLELDGYLTGIVVTPQAVPILPSTWIARLWGDDEPIFEDEAQINTVLGAVMIHYNTLLRDIDRSLERLEADRMVDYRPLFLSADQKPAHDAVRTASGRRWSLPPRPGVRSWRTSGARPFVGVAQEIQRRQLRRRYAHASRIRLLIDDGVRNARHVLAVEEREDRSSGTDLEQAVIRDDLKFHHGLVCRLHG
jgi:hypothetical protein